MHFNILTLFPDFFQNLLSYGILSQAIKKKLLTYDLISIRKFTTDVHQSVDDRPFGGGDGMVLSYQPLSKALLSIKNRGEVVYLSPQGSRWTQKKAQSFSTNYSTITLICGRYSGIDARWIHQYVDQEISIGDYILSGGEPAVLVVMDSISRCLPGVLGNPKSLKEDSFGNKGLLEYPQWTRPKSIKGYKIPDVFFSGHHEQINRARYWLSLLKTKQTRSDLLGDHLKADLKKAEKWLADLSMEEKKACGLMK